MSSEVDMVCRELVELVTDYLEGALAPEDRTRLERHLNECDGCAAYIEQIRTTIRLTGRLTAESIPAEAREGLLRAFRAWKSSR